ncbi:MAG: hypothetical protein ABIT83_23430 [Massilia sp.]
MSQFANRAKYFPRIGPQAIELGACNVYCSGTPGNTINNQS